jgi:hypothetical protein
MRMEAHILRVRIMLVVGIIRMAGTLAAAAEGMLVEAVVGGVRWKQIVRW